MARVGGNKPELMKSSECRLADGFFRDSQFDLVAWGMVMM